MDSNRHAAAGPAAGFAYQFERALDWLAQKETGASIGIETADDVEVRNSDTTSVLEQDKHSIRQEAQPFSDRSKGLWNTLGIWIEAIDSRERSIDLTSFLMATNNPVPECIARRIARAIKQREPADTAELAALVAGVVHVSGRRERTHPATRTFQALRIAVNDELRALHESLDAALDRTLEGGRIAAISFHSLEDRIVKQRFRDDPRAVRVTRKPVVPSAAEIAANPRARSAKLRVCTVTHPAAGGQPT